MLSIQTQERIQKFKTIIRWPMDNVWRKIFPPYLRIYARFFGGLLIASAVLLAVFQKGGDNHLRVYFFNVGQGDASLIQQGNFQILIDGGPNAGIVQKLGDVLPFNDREIELMILTHPHADHLTGQIEILRRYKVKKVLYTGVIHTTDEYLEWLEEIKKQDIPMEIAKAGAQYVIASEVQRSEAIPSDKEGDRHAPQDAGLAMTPSAILNILYPFDDLSGQRVAGQAPDSGGLNDTSMVARLIYGQTSFLFMGDASSEVEEELLSSHFTVDSSRFCNEETNDCQPITNNLITNNSRLSATVLKVGHHGSRFSTSKEFVEAVQPKYAVIQVGKNDYGHPAFRTLWRLEEAGTQVFRTDKDGDVTFASDGKEIEVTSDKQ